MALVDIAPIRWPSASDHLATTMLGNTVNASGEGTAVVCFVPVSGVVDRVGFELSAVTNANASTQITVALQTVDLTNGDPTGTLYDTANGQWQKTGSAIISNGWNWFDFTGGDGNGAATVAKGDLVAIVIEMTTLGGADIFDVEMTSISTWGRKTFPYSTNNTGAGYVPSVTGGANAVLEYASTTYHPMPELAGVGFHVNNTASLERGIRFRVPFKCRMSGFVPQAFRPNASQTTTVFHLMADATAPGGTRLASSPTIEDDVGGGVGSYQRQGYVRFGSPVELVAGTWYRLVHTPAGGNSIIQKIPVASNAVLTQVFGTTDFYWTQDDTASGWTDETDQFCTFFPVFDQLDDGAGGGGSGVIKSAGSGGGMVG